MNLRTIIPIIITAVFSLVSKAGADSLLLESGSKPATVLELYTSQGCSSCPPAERWLSSFVDHPSLWEDIIPINFHVDYWDYLGWKDPFGMAGFSERQRQYRQLGHSRNVATPGFVVNGKGWNGWFRKKGVPNKPSLVNVTLKAVIDKKMASIAFEREGNKKTRVHVAILGFGIKIPIKYGENRGLELTHDFVVIGYDSRLLQGINGDFSADMLLPAINNESMKAAVKRRSVVVWVSEQSDVAPIQAVAGWL